MLFFGESYRRDTSDVPVPDFAAWTARSDSDYETPEKRQMRGKEISIPLLPARVMKEEGCRRELAAAGFAAERFPELTKNRQIPYSARYT